MKCPHCAVAIHEGQNPVPIFDYPDFKLPKGEINLRQVWYVDHQRCPECGGVIIWLRSFIHSKWESWVVHPKSSLRPIPPDVTAPYRQDFNEAALVLRDSEKASAALSRRCLQSILRDKAGIKPSDLYNEIEEVISSGRLPTDIADALHVVRVIGNLAAH